MITALAITAFVAGLLLAVRVMFFGVRHQLTEEQLHHRKWPLAVAAFRGQDADMRPSGRRRRVSRRMVEVRREIRPVWPFRLVFTVSFALFALQVLAELLKSIARISAPRAAK